LIALLEMEAGEMQELDFEVGRRAVVIVGTIELGYPRTNPR